MNAETNRFPSLELSVFRATLIILCVITPGMAESQPEPPPETLTAKVSLAGVALSTPEGQRVAHERLLQTARRLCSGLETLHPQSLAHHPTYIKCVDETLARALRQIDGPVLAATHKSPR